MQDGRREISGNVYLVRLYILHVIYIEDKGHISHITVPDVRTTQFDRRGSPAAKRRHSRERYLALFA